MNSKIGKKIIFTFLALFTIVLIDGISAISTPVKVKTEILDKRFRVHKSSTGARRYDHFVSISNTRDIKIDSYEKWKDIALGSTVNSEVFQGKFLHIRWYTKIVSGPNTQQVSLIHK